MADEVKIAVYENGELSVPVKGGNCDEAVLALPLDSSMISTLPSAGIRAWSSLTSSVIRSYLKPSVLDLLIVYG